ncbi:MAG: glycosyltransferase family 2 protein [Cyclobacteriaceae bacterium]|nr:glycosyltransferase family 2 protein [Cyclobacteriaceae bacterium]
MQASIIIPTKDRLHVLDETLIALSNAAEGIDVEIIVVNDSKTTKPRPQAGGIPIAVIDNPGNGVASARNMGASVAASECLIFMDDDFLIERKHLLNAMEYARKEPNRVYLFDWSYPPQLVESMKDHHFGRYLIRYGFTSLRGWLSGEWGDDEVFELKGGASYFFAINKSMFVLVGGYDERFPHAGAEDYDFVSRLRRLGVRYYLDKRMTIYHNEKDRLDPMSFFARKRRNGETIAKAIELGYPELAVEYPLAKRAALSVLSRIKPAILWVQSAIPNLPVWDGAYFRLTNLLLAIYFFEGYSTKEQ